MYRLSYLLFQGFFFFVIHEEFPLLHYGVIHQVGARVRGKFACQDDVMNLDCRPSKALTIYSAEYSKKQASVCSRGNNAEYCDPVDKTSLVRKLCEGQIKCSVTVNKSTMGDKCPTVSKYLNVMYECKTLPPSTEPPYVENKSTMVLTRPSTTPPLSNHSNGYSFHSTGNPTKMVFYSTSFTKKEEEEESTPAVYGFVLYNGGSVGTISGFLVVVTMALIILL